MWSQTKRYIPNSVLNFRSLYPLSTTALILSWGYTFQKTSNSQAKAHLRTLFFQNSSKWLLLYIESENRLSIFGTSHQRCSIIKKVSLKFSQNSQENTWVRAFFLWSLLKMRVQHMCFPANFVKFLRTSIL